MFLKLDDIQGLKFAGNYSPFKDFKHVSLYIYIYIASVLALIFQCSCLFLTTASFFAGTDLPMS